MAVDLRLAEELRLIARREGIDRVGVCDARPFLAEREVIEDRKRRGLAAGMQFTYRNPSRSTDPQRSLPGARSFLVGARSYLRSEPGDSPAASGRVARYSWSDHYLPLRTALGRVADRLRDEGWKALVLVDENSAVDRAVAVRAGLGWFGKNANVLLPGAGSWFVLGSVLTDAPIAPSHVAGIGDGCGTCRRCLDGCPTGAIVEPGVIDARRCLAWLVQAPGTFPPELRRALGDRVYGCDECQEVCPPNRVAARRRPPPDPEDGSQPWVDLVWMLSADDDELEASLGRWYIPGRDVRFLRRNALIALGNIADPQDARVEETLLRYLRSPDGLLRAHAVWSAGSLGRVDLLVGMAGDPDPSVRAELAAAGAA